MCHDSYHDFMMWLVATSLKANTCFKILMNHLTGLSDLFHNTITCPLIQDHEVLSQLQDLLNHMPTSVTKVCMVVYLQKCWWTMSIEKVILVSFLFIFPFSLMLYIYVLCNYDMFTWTFPTWNVIVTVAFSERLIRFYLYLFFHYCTILYLEGTHAGTLTGTWFWFSGPYPNWCVTPGYDHRADS